MEDGAKQCVGYVRRSRTVRVARALVKFVASVELEPVTA
jgi:hypothetical protein